MEHNFCVFYKNDRLSFGWIREVKKNKFFIVPVTGKEFSCPQSRIEYSWKAKIFSEAKEAINYLNEKIPSLETKSKEIDLQTIHELCEPDRPYTIKQLATDFLDEPEDEWSQSALFFALKNNPLLFKEKKDSFVARSSEEIEKFKNDEIRVREKKRREENEQLWAELLLKGKPPQIESEEKDHWDHFIYRINQYLIYFEDSQEKAYFESLFKCNRKESIEIERLFIGFLNRLGFKLSWGQLLIQRSGLSIKTTPEEREEIETLSSLTTTINSEPTSIDLRFLPTFTVDSEGTKDFDDAISFEQKSNGSTLYVHISNVDSFISSSSALFKRVEQNISSLYTLKKIYHMFPMELSENLFSLIEQRDRSVMTFEIEFDQSHLIQSSKIYRSIINVDKNLTYTSIDQAIEENRDIWPQVWDICETLRATRFENGALEVDREEAILDISDPAYIQIEGIRKNTPASLMIQELAVTANHIAAKFCRENGTLALFRNQPPYKIVEHVENNVKPMLRDVIFKPATIDLESEGHAALGLDCYLQVTSPIRRFSDLICQKIIFQQIDKGECGFERDQILEWAKRCETISKKLTQLERTLSNHWKIKYLAQNREKLFQTRFLRTLRKGKNLFNIIPLQLTVAADFPADPDNETTSIKILEINTDLDQVIIQKAEMNESSSPGTSNLT